MRTWRKWLSDPPISVPVSIIAQRLAHRRFEIARLSLTRELLFANMLLAESRHVNSHFHFRESNTVHQQAI
jgi:hypothetical protein